MMDSRRIVCESGHLLVTLKTEPESADTFAADFIASQGGVCMYCSRPLHAASATVMDFEAWASRADRCHTMGAPLS